jgi:hypothetical protein
MGLDVRANYVEIGFSAHGNYGRRSEARQATRFLRAILNFFGGGYMPLSKMALSFELVGVFCLTR